MAFRDLDVLDAAERADDCVENLIARYGGRLLHVGQLRRSVHAISAAIGEAFGRRVGPDRAHRLEIAQSEAEEAIRHLYDNYRNRRLAKRDYWPLHDLLVVIVKMLESLRTTM